MQPTLLNSSYHIFASWQALLHPYSSEWFHQYHAVASSPLQRLTEEQVMLKECQT
jgi:hypothetical protein